MTKSKIKINPFEHKGDNTALIQACCHSIGIDAGPIDGLRGPQTRYAEQQLSIRLNGNNKRSYWRNQFETDKTSSLVAQYGNPNARHTIKTVRVPCPWAMVLAWDIGTGRKDFIVHETHADSLTNALDAIRKEYTDDQIRDMGLHLFGGDFNIRRKRGGSSWSMHAYGLAIDFDPERNQLRWDASSARLAQPDAEPFWQIWEAHGWHSLGRTKNYDWMHVQAVKV